MIQFILCFANLKISTHLLRSILPTPQFLLFLPDGSGSNRNLCQCCYCQCWKQRNKTELFRGNSSPLGFSGKKWLRSVVGRWPAWLVNHGRICFLSLSLIVIPRTLDCLLIEPGSCKRKEGWGDTYPFCWKMCAPACMNNYIRHGILFDHIICNFNICIYPHM